jgi:hypothetical protein
LKTKHPIWARKIIVKVEIIQVIWIIANYSMPSNYLQKNLMVFTCKVKP